LRFETRGRKILGAGTVYRRQTGSHPERRLMVDDSRIPEEEREVEPEERDAEDDVELHGGGKKGGGGGYTNPVEGPLPS